ncbi:QcrA and Rieske domain-containing protein [Gulosibacter molinativorax]|uniref:Cytochrome bc1 complex Rieske iron-sulfur subunit n=1 Tax=Gulosibacter molinativorax TaxID=256821 RepID=A0ABT7C5T4_9MICO|nr:Rieske (2Fe-2S) protein [Gulosibacter molinativorax]MDJ1370550.1 hypothetical protein [Gulosibacter molinativorax]QUY62037.1 FeS-binding protein [Gulosibacter molinativorax]
MIEQLPSDTVPSTSAGSREDPTGPSRRVFIRSAALIGGGTAAAFLLSACSSGSQDAGETAAPVAEPVTLPAAEVPVGGGVVIKASEVVVTQPTEGQFLAFTAICTHQGCVLTDVQDRGAHCGCHGSYYDISTGEPVAGPAQEPLTSIPVAVSGDTLTIG